MKSEIDAILRDYGENVTVVATESTTAVRAFFRLMTQKSLQNMRASFTGLGELPPGQYLYMGPATVAVQRGDRLRWDGRWFDVRQAETICAGGETLYCWALAVPGGEEAAWNW